MSKPAAIQPVSAALHISLLLYAENGVGKTPMLGTGDKTLILDADNGVTSAAVSGSTAERWFLRDWGDFSDALTYLAEEGHRVYRWAWLDSVTGMQDRGLAQIMDDLVANPRFAHRDKYAPDKGEYGRNMTHLSDAIRIFKGLPMNVGMTAHPVRWDASDTESEALAEYVYWPFIQGKNMIPKICGHFDVIAYMDYKFHEGKPYQVLYTGGRQRFYARDRFGALPERMVNPTIPKIEAAIKSKINSKSTPMSQPAGAAISTNPIQRARQLAQQGKRNK